MSRWQDEKAERNRRAVARLTKALPAVFPSAVLSRALGRAFVPPTPRLAIDRLLARASVARRSLGAGVGSAQWSARRLDMAAGRQPQERITGHIPRTARAVPRARLFARCRLLLCVRAAGLPLWLACRSLGRRSKQKCQLALRLRDRLAVLECAQQRGESPCAACRPAAAPRAADGCGRPPRSITACRCFGCGANGAIRRGRRCSTIGACPTCR